MPVLLLSSGFWIYLICAERPSEVHGRSGCMIDVNGGLSALENQISPITEEKYNQYKNLHDRCQEAGMKKNAHGTVFAVPLPDGTFVTGRVMLDINACLKRRLFPADSPLPGLGQAYLVDMYSAVTRTPESILSAPLVRGAFLESDEVGESWPVVGHKAVDPREVEFPETIIGFMTPEGECAFECGEMRLPLPFQDRETEKMGEFKARHSAFIWPFTCLRMLGRDNEVPTDYKTASLQGTDLRQSQYRRTVYEYLPFSMARSYFEKQKTDGPSVDPPLRYSLRNESISTTGMNRKSVRSW